MENNPFINLLSLKEASNLCNIDESTLRKAISAKRFVMDKDIKKFGKQWVITKQALKREYGDLFYDESYHKQIDTQLINMLIINAVNAYAKKHKTTISKCIKLFEKRNIINHLIVNYDYYHLQGIDQTVIDLKELIDGKEN